MSSIGPLIIDVAGLELSAEDKELLQHPLVGGVILFSRNYESKAQLTQLCQQIRQVKKTPLLITVDQEGGRVQRFRTEFLQLPSMGELGKRYDHSPEAAIKLAQTGGWLMAAELLAVGIDLSFAPVLDVDKKTNPAIGDRAFHRQPNIVIQLAKAWTQGMSTAGMASVGKHFPGHGSVSVDSHLDLPIDSRSFEEILVEDLVPFIQMIKSGMPAIMAAHILFPAIDNMPVGFSRRWLHDILRQQCGFTGIVFSDDLSMHGAKIAGDFPDRADAALEAGCDMALICNNRPAVIKTVDSLSKQRYFLSGQKFSIIKGRFFASNTLTESQQWKEKYNDFTELVNAATC